MVEFFGVIVSHSQPEYIRSLIAGEANRLRCNSQRRPTPRKRENKFGLRKVTMLKVCKLVNATTLVSLFAVSPSWFVIVIGLSLWTPFRTLSTQLCLSLSQGATRPALLKLILVSYFPFLLKTRPCARTLDALTCSALASDDKCTHLLLLARRLMMKKSFLAQYHQHRLRCCYYAKSHLRKLDAISASRRFVSS